MAWTAVCCAILFGLMKYFGILRISKSVEKAGIDRIDHGEQAYPTKSYVENEHPYNVTVNDSKFSYICFVINITLFILLRWWGGRLGQKNFDNLS